MRNYIRRQLLPRFDEAARANLLHIIKNSGEMNEEIDTLLVKYLSEDKAEMNRRRFIMLPHDVAKESMAAWLRANDIRNFDTNMLERLTVAAKTARAGAQFDVPGPAKLEVTANNLALTGTDR